MRRFGKFLMIVGAGLIAAALCLFLYNEWESRQAEEVSNGIVESIVEVIGETTQEDAWYDPYQTEMTVVEIDGYYYIGYVSIPTLNLYLPVMSEWSYPNLKISPCRYTGSTFTYDLVIAAHNYATHFGRIKNLAEGDDVYFIDMDGRTWHYQVALVDTLAPTDIELMTDSGYDLTLFTCTYGGASGVTVRCNLAEE